MSCHVGEVMESLENELILQPFFRFSYVTGFHLRHLASRPCKIVNSYSKWPPLTHTQSLVFVAAQQLNYLTYQPENLQLRSKEIALNFQY